MVAGACVAYQTVMDLEVRAAVESPEKMKIETIYSNKQAFQY